MMALEYHIYLHVKVIILIPMAANTIRAESALSGQKTCEALYKYKVHLSEVKLVPKLS